MWFDVEAIPLARIEELPYSIENTALLDATPDRVFRIWAEGEGQTEWFQDWVGCRWTTAHRGVDAEREAELKLLTVKERFLAWDPGKRLTFHIYGITLPLVSAMVEDMTFEPAGATATRFRWVVRYRPTTLMRVFHPIARMIFSEMFRASTENLARWIKAHPG